MSNVPTLYQRNAKFAEAFDKADLPIKPNLSMIVLSCVDARVDPAFYAGIELGDALVLRNVGARVTDAVALEVTILWTLMSMASGASPELEFAIVQHTGCGMARFADPDVAAKVTERFGTSSVVETYAIDDLAQTVAGDIERLRKASMVPRLLNVSGHIYDIATGELSEVVAPQPLA